MPTLRVGDQVLAYTQHTDGDTPLIFIHGILASQYSWLDFPLRFARYGRVITLSLPGHYPAQFPPDMPQAYISDRWVGDTLAAAVEQITGGQPAILIGHSTGAYACLAVAWRAPHLVKLVISLAGFVRGTWTSVLGFDQRLQYLGKIGDLLFAAQMTLGTRSALLQKFSSYMSTYDKAGLRANTSNKVYFPRIMKDVSQLHIPSMRMWFYQMYTVADLAPYLAHIQAPVLAIAGKQDALVPLSQAHAIAKHVPDAQCVLLDKMNHMLFAEQPERVYACMVKWLDAHV